MLPAKLESPPPATDLKALAGSYNALGVDLWKRIEEKGNLSMSPASIGLALAMTYLGARGETAAQMKKTMHLTLEGPALEKAHASLLYDWLAEPPSEGLELRVANRLFIEKTLKVEAPFAEATKTSFGAPAELLDFVTQAQKSRQHINEWVEKQTRERIEELLPPDGVNSDTRLVLTNAIYFKAKWSSVFEKAATTPKPFHAAGGRTVQVPTMAQVASFPYRDAGDVEVLDLGYEGGRFAMSIVLPKKRDGLAAVEAKLSSTVLDRWVGGQPSYQRVSLELPRFTIQAPSDALRLKEPLAALGMPLAFDRQRADFTGIHVFNKPEDRLLISNVFHKAFVEVNERGTEAAAATAVSMARAGAAPPTEEPKPFVVDHPFLFVIRDAETGMVLFLGRVTEPK